jgi:hypothetical protein
MNAPPRHCVEDYIILAPECFDEAQAPNFSVEAPAPDSTVPDYSVEVSVEVPDPDYYPVDHILAPRIYSVEAHIMKLPCSEFAPKKYSVAPEVVAKCPRQDSV